MLFHDLFFFRSNEANETIISVHLKIKLWDMQIDENNSC